MTALRKRKHLFNSEKTSLISCHWSLSAPLEKMRMVFTCVSAGKGWIDLCTLPDVPKSVHLGCSVKFRIISMKTFMREALTLFFCNVASCWPAKSIQKRIFSD